MSKSWTEEELDRAIKLFDEGYQYHEIAEKLDRTKKSISLKLNRIGLNALNNDKYFKHKIFCLYCGYEFEDLKSKGRKFCSQSCSASYNNIGSQHSSETKQKISNAIYKYLEETLDISKRKTKINCPVCGYKTFNEKYCSRQCCGIARKGAFDYKRNKDISKYRHKCKFKFNVYHYPNEFNLKLLKEHGWYKATNNGNNINGVSRDHKYSVKRGFENNVDPEIISHPANCKLMIHPKNIYKKAKCSITLQQLKKDIKVWDNKY